MSNDAKLGLVVGVGIVIAVAVVYFRHDGAARKQEETPAATGGKPAPAAGQFPARGQTRPTKARPAVQNEESAQAQSEPRRHTVAEGDTLASLAERYYGDKDKSEEIYRANRDALKGPDDLPVGVTLIIPELAKGEAEGHEP
jgi:nucleoid-associated protein YgaU